MFASLAFLALLALFALFALHCFALLAIASLASLALFSLLCLLCPVCVLCLLYLLCFVCLVSGRGLCRKLFGVEYVTVQPHSGSQANAAVMLSCLKPGDKILGFNLSHGGHLTHGSPVNFSGKLYNTSFYNVEKDSGLINYDKLEETALNEKPQMIICGASAYSQDWDYAKFREIADKIGCLLLGDIAHPAGLIAANLLNNPAKYCHILSICAVWTKNIQIQGIKIHPLPPKDYFAVLFYTLSAHLLLRTSLNDYAPPFFSSLFYLASAGMLKFLFVRPSLIC